VKLSGGEADRLSELSSRALAVVSEATGMLYGPMLTLYRRKDTAKPYLNRAQSRLRDLLGHVSLQTILDLIGDAPDTEAEQRTLHAMAASGIRTVWRGVVSTLRDPLAVARASIQLRYNMQQKFGEDLMTESTSSEVGTRVHAVLYDMDAHLTPASRASIRSAATELPLDAWLALASAPVADTEQPETRQVWETVVRALGVMRQGGPSVGRALSETDYPEARLSSLLTAHGDALTGLIAEAVRWLVSHDIKRCTLTDIVVLGLADAHGDRAAHDDIVARIALDYARATRRKR